ncbi:hypothetical protein ABIC84_005016 [Mucilaginibacter sp. 3215]
MTDANLRNDEVTTKEIRLNILQIKIVCNKKIDNVQLSCIQLFINQSPTIIYA